MDERRQQPDRRETARGRDRRRPPGPMELAAVGRIKAAIEQQGLSLEAVAARSGVAYGTLWRVLEGCEFRVSTLEAIAAALNIPAKEIFRAA
jgi:lambda repressor-like predicted transcriptional regulator